MDRKQPHGSLKHRDSECAVLAHLMTLKMKWYGHVFIERLKLEAHLATPFMSMSYGTKKKFLFVAGSIGSPRYLFLDEPMNGLDAHACGEIFHYLSRHLQDNKGCCVMVSHDLQWIDHWRETCDYRLLALTP